MIPEGITTALVHMDAPVSFVGDPGRLHVTITPSAPLVWAETGTPMGNFIDLLSLDTGEPLEVQLPHTDQDGFLDNAGNSFSGWYYTISVVYEKDGQRVNFPSRDFQILTGQDSVDLALLPAGEAYIPEIAPILPVTDIGGFTGSVSLEDLGLDLVDNTPDATKPVSGPTVAALALKADNTALAAHTGDTANPHAVTKAQVGLGNADNTSDADKPVSILQAAALAGKSNVGHGHTYADISGTVPTSALPPLAINETFPVASQAAMLALVAQRGDVAIRTDVAKSFILATDNPGTLADWKEFIATGQVVSVAGKTGVVALVKADVGLGSVDNTADVDKPVSTAMSAALAGKAGINDFALNVLFNGVVGDGVTDDTAALQAAVNSAATFGVGVYMPAKPYKVSGTCTLSAIVKPIRITVEKGAVITTTADLPVFEAVGSFGTWTNLAANGTRNNRTFAVTSAAGYAVGDWIQIASSNTASGGTDKIGWLRRIVGIAGTTFTIDASLPRSVFTAQGAHIQKATFVPQIDLVGGGQIRHVDGTSNFKTLVNMCLVKEPQVALELGPSGGPGVTFSHCLGGGTQPGFYVHDLVDDEPGGHFGYGINLAGSSRNMRFYGVGERCRHTITTNVGPNITNSNQYGEPEDCHIELTTRDCTNKAIDSHRPGWGITIVPSHSGGSGGGIQIRADNVHVRGGVISGSNSVGIAVASNITVMPSIIGTSISNIAGAGSPAILCDSPTMISNPMIYGFTGAGIRTSSTAPGCVINNPLIDGVSAGVLIGIDLQSNDNIVTLGRVSNVGTGIKLNGTTGNSYSTVAFGSGVTTQVVTT